MNEALEILKKYYGYTSFKEGQKEIIDNLLSCKDTMGIMPTGGGKSICYQIPGLIFEGITLVISPLISLMKDQVDALESAGVKATVINSSLSLKESNIRFNGIVSGDYKIIYVSPERLLSEYFLDRIEKIEISFVAVDEAHCISQWGHDFRKSYLNIATFLKNLPEKPVVGAFTATATPHVRKDIKEKLQINDADEFINGFNRENLYLSVVKGESGKDFIKRYLKERKDESGIIYASTRKEVEAIYEELKRKKYKVGKYHAGMTEKQRIKNQDNFIFDRVEIIVATNAFGMGIDKSNVRFVIHNNIPKDLESYYQEAGRAGRDGLDSECVLVFNPKDIMLQRYFISNNKFEVSDEIKDIKYRKLNEIVNYCNTSQCLRTYILEYFGEDVEDKSCNNCSACLEDSTKKDITIEAHKIISCVGKTQGAFGTQVIAMTLNGSKSKKILERGLDKISTYGIMSEYSVKEIKEIINLLTGDGYLRIAGGEYPVLKLTKQAYELIKSDKKVYMQVLEIETHKEDFGLFAKLKELRMEISRKENVPPFVVFSDNSLLEMCKYLPKNDEEMLNIKGVGEHKLEKYGKIFLDEIAKFFESNTQDKGSFVVK